jgi:opacity protein-like surface antigen
VLVVLGVGTAINFATRYFADLSYRYGRIGEAKSGDEILIKGLGTQRVQIGLGIRF